MTSVFDMNLTHRCRLSMLARLWSCPSDVASNIRHYCWLSGYQPIIDTVADIDISSSLATLQVRHTGLASNVDTLWIIMSELRVLFRALRGTRPAARIHRFPIVNPLTVPLCRSLVTESSETDSVSQQNRKRALEYLQQYTKEGLIQDNVIAHEPLSPSMTRSRPSAKELARARLKKHIPIVTGRVPSTDQLAKLIESEHGAQNVVALDVRDKASFADWLVLCCGFTANHVLAIADGVAQDMRALDILVNGEIVTVSGRNSADWMVVDIGPVIVHVMTDEARDRYRLEDLWQPERVSTNENTEGFHGSLS